MKKLAKVCLLVIIICCSLICVFLSACAGSGWFTNSKTVRGQADGLADYLSSPENYYIFVTRYEEYETPNSDELSRKAVFKALYLYTDSGVCYYELDLKTGGAAHYSDGVLRNYYDGEETVTEGGTTFAEDWGNRLIEVMRDELSKDVQGKHTGYHYALFNYDKVFYVNDTNVSFEGAEFTSFVANFHAHKDAPKYRNYELKIMNSTLSYELKDNVSNMTPEYVAQNYDYFKQFGE